MTNDPPPPGYGVAGECRKNDEARMTRCHPERSAAKSKQSVEWLFGFATRFLDFARNDGHLVRHSSLGIRHSSLSPYLSHSPMTKSRLPNTAGTSLTMQFGRSSGRILRFTNDGARIFNRYGTPPPLLLM